VKTKKIISKAFVRSPQAEYIQERCALLRTLQKLDVVSAISMRYNLCIDGKKRWALEVTCVIEEKGEEDDE